MKMPSEDWRLILSIQRSNFFFNHLLAKCSLPRQTAFFNFLQWDGLSVRQTRFFFTSARPHSSECLTISNTKKGTDDHYNAEGC